MARRRTTSLESLSSLIAAIHDAGVDGTKWPLALRRLGGLFDASRAAIWMQDKAGGYRALHTLEPDDRITRDYTEHYGRYDLLRPAIMRVPAGTVLTGDMVIPRADFVRTEFYADFAAPHGLADSIQARVFDGERFRCIVSISSTAENGAFEREHVQLLTLLLPHLNRAMRTQLRLASLGVERDSALEALDRLRHGVLLVDAQARVLHANRVAEAIMRGGNRLGVEPASGGRRLRAATPGQTAALRRLVAQAAAGRHVDRVPSEAGGGTLRLDCDAERPLLVSVSPLRAEAAWNVSPQPAALVLIGEPESEAALTSPTHLRTLYGLTAAEAAVAERIAQGGSVKDAAEALGVAPSTLRWHLQHVFEKTGTVRQSELVRLIGRLDFISDG